MAEQKCRDYINLIDRYFRENGYNQWVRGKCVVTQDTYRHKECNVVYTNNEPNTSFSHMDIQAEVFNGELDVSISTRGTTEITQKIRDARKLRIFLEKYFPRRTTPAEIKNKTDMELYEFVRTSQFPTQIDHIINEIKLKFQPQFQDEEFKKTIGIILNSMIVQSINPVAPLGMNQSDDEGLNQRYQPSDNIWIAMDKITDLISRK